MTVYKLRAKSNKGKNRLAQIKHEFPDWDETWEASRRDFKPNPDQIFIHPRLPEAAPFRFARWVEFATDPNFDIIAVG